MSKSISEPAKNAAPLSAVMTDLSPTQVQSLSQAMMDATLEAQGLIADFIQSGKMPNFTSVNPDPFGSLAANSKLGAALVRRPERAIEAATKLVQNWSGLYTSMLQGKAPDKDRRFADPEWSLNPSFDFMRRAWKLNGDWIQSLVDLVAEDLDQETKTKARFFLRQIVDASAPTNVLASNPQALRAFVESEGQSLLNGIRQARADLKKGKGKLAISQTDDTAFEVGKNIATTKGKIIYRSKLIEIIHYNPTEKKTFERPLLIFPPWINKYYILDLQPANSLIGWLLSQGIDTYVVSWRSADDDTKDLTWDDYIALGVLDALDVVTEDSGSETVNSVGYCIGGTLLSSAMAYMGKVGDKRIHSATLFTSQSDFTDAGELKLFTDDGALEHIYSVIDANDGMMPGKMMGETFNWLRPSDLVWRYVVDNYMLGKPPRPFDLLYWNSDQTNIPGPTHKTYLKAMYNENALSEGKFEVFGEPVSLQDVTVPVFLQAGITDHICPWKSIYRGAQNYSGDVMFMLAGSGHIAGVINHPDAKKYQHWTNPDLPETAADWAAGAEEHPGSWWPYWMEWLGPISGELVNAKQPADMGLGDAPGQYAAMRIVDIEAGKKPAGPLSSELKAKPKPAPKKPAKKPAAPRKKKVAAAPTAKTATTSKTPAKRAKKKTTTASTARKPTARKKPAATKSTASSRASARK